MWELGQPRARELMVAHSGVQAYGTDLDAPYADGATIALRSPVIDLTGELRPELSFWYFVDVTEGQEGVQVNYLDEAGTVLVGIDEIFWTKTDGWTLYEETIPEVARGRKIMIEWLFRSDGESPNGQGFFLDDVMID